MTSIADKIVFVVLGFIGALALLFLLFLRRDAVETASGGGRKRQLILGSGLILLSHIGLLVGCTKSKQAEIEYFTLPPSETKTELDPPQKTFLSRKIVGPDAETHSVLTKIDELFTEAELIVETEQFPKEIPALHYYLKRLNYADSKVDSLLENGKISEVSASYIKDQIDFFREQFTNHIDVEERPSELTCYLVGNYHPFEQELSERVRILTDLSKERVLSKDVVIRLIISTEKLLNQANPSGNPTHDTSDSESVRVLLGSLESAFFYSLPKPKPLSEDAVALVDEMRKTQSTLRRLYNHPPSKVEIDQISLSLQNSRLGIAAATEKTSLSPLESHLIISSLDGQLLDLKDKNNDKVLRCFRFLGEKEPLLLELLLSDEVHAEVFRLVADQTIYEIQTLNSRIRPIKNILSEEDQENNHTQVRGFFKPEDRPRARALVERTVVILEKLKKRLETNL